MLYGGITAHNQKSAGSLESSNSLCSVSKCYAKIKINLGWHDLPIVVYELPRGISVRHLFVVGSMGNDN